MAFLADEHTSDNPAKATDREYLWFALVLIALLVVSEATSAPPIDPSEMTTISSQ